VRVVWGGDETVAALRELPLAPHATELLFGDRFSFAAVRAGVEDHQAAAQLFNDAYWFDQRGCASPRLVVAVGEADAAWATLERLFAELDRVVVARGYELELGAVMAKRTHAYEALAERPVRRYREPRNELTVIELETLDGFDRTHPGAGLFYAAVAPELAALSEFVVQKDQTMTVHGFGEDELAGFVHAANGRGVDRVVPFGQALAFGRYWDGHDLLQALTRRVHIPR
jgi:hypothetical protein